MKAMRILVTGGAGFIGSFLVDRLLALGHAVRVLDHLDPQVHPQGPPAYLSREVELVVADIRNRSRCAEVLQGMDAVVHAAAAVGVAQSLYKVEHYVDVNVRGTATLLQCIADGKQRLQKLIVLTSMTGYGEGMYRRRSDGHLVRVGIRTEDEIRQFGWDPVCPTTGEPFEPMPTPEEAELLARNIYALTKRYQEEMALSLGALYGFPVVCLRLFNVYGPRQALTNPYTGVLAIFLGRLLAAQAPIVYEDGFQTRDFISVHDVVNAILAAMNSPAADGKVINICSGIPRQIGEVARTLARIAGVPDLEPTITREFRRGDVRHCTGDLRRARQMLDFQPSVEWEEGLRELVQWCSRAFAVDRFAQADEELRARGLITERIGPTRA